MECPEAQDWLHRYVEGELEPVVTGLVERHLESCPPCRAVRAELEEERLWVIEEALRTPRFSESFRRKVLGQLEQEAQRIRAVRRRNGFFRLSGAAAALFVLGLAALQTVNGPGTPELALEAPKVSAETRNLGEPGPTAPRMIEFRRTVEPAPRVEPRSRSVVVDSSLTRADQGHLVRQVGEMISAAVHIGSPGVRARPEYRDSPCRPDPNRDGKMDLNDLAYSCQILLTGNAPQETLGDSDATVLDPDCLDICLKV